MAQEAAESGGGANARMYIMSYFLVVLCIGLGMLAVCRSSRRRDRPKGEEREVSGLIDAIEAKKGEVPVILVGMAQHQVAKLIGKPKIVRTGADIYRELAQAGKLSEEDAAKEYSIYETPAGRYELVLLEKRVIEVRLQPSAAKKEE